MKFRVWDSAKKEYVNRGIYWKNSDTLLLIQSDGTGYFDGDEINPQYTIELNTGFTDSEGTEIFCNDILHTPHTGQDSACMKPEGYDYHVGWCQDKGQWVLYSYDLGFKMLYAPLFMYAHKGIVTGRYDEL